MLSPLKFSGYVKHRVIISLLLAMERKYLAFERDESIIIFGSLALKKSAISHERREIELDRTSGWRDQRSRRRFERDNVNTGDTETMLESS